MCSERQILEERSRVKKSYKLCLYFDFLKVELHLVTEGQDCHPIGQSTIRLNEVLDYPSNKLHGSVVVYASATQKNQPAKTNMLGTLEYWFKLNTSGE